MSGSTHIAKYDNGANANKPAYGLLFALFKPGIGCETGYNTGDLVPSGFEPVQMYPDTYVNDSELVFPFDARVKYDSGAGTHYLAISGQSYGKRFDYCTAYYHTGSTDLVTAISLQYNDDGTRATPFFNQKGEWVYIDCHPWPPAPPSNPPLPPTRPPAPPPSSPAPPAQPSAKCCDRYGCKQADETAFTIDGVYFAEGCGGGSKPKPDPDPNPNPNAKVTPPAPAASTLHAPAASTHLGWP